MHCAIVVEPAAGNYSACVLYLPSCAATGATVAEVEAEIRDAIAFHIEGMREDGTALSAPSLNMRNSLHDNSTTAMANFLRFY